MTIEEAQVARDMLKSHIETLVDEFEKQTKFMVADVNLERDGFGELGGITLAVVMR